MSRCTAASYGGAGSRRSRNKVRYCAMHQYLPLFAGGFVRLVHLVLH